MGDGILTIVPSRRFIDQDETLLIIVFCPENPGGNIKEEIRNKESEIPREQTDRQAGRQATKQVNRSFAVIFAHAPFQESVLRFCWLENYRSIVFSNLRAA